MTRAEKQARLGATNSSSPQLVIPKVPSLPLPAKVAAAFPDLKAWHDQTTEAVEGWRVKANIAVLGIAPP